MTIVDWVLITMLLVATIAAIAVFALVFDDWKHLRRMRALQRLHYDLRIKK